MADKTAPDKPETPRLVRATRMVFYGGMRIRPGKTFTLVKPSTEFAEGAMEYADGAPDDIAAAVAASPKSRGSAGVTLKSPAGKVAKGALEPDPGI